MLPCCATDHVYRLAMLTFSFICTRALSRAFGCVETSSGCLDRHLTQSGARILQIFIAGADAWVLDDPAERKLSLGEPYLVASHMAGPVL